MTHGARAGMAVALVLVGCASGDQEELALLDDEPDPDPVVVRQVASDICVRLREDPSHMRLEVRERQLAAATRDGFDEQRLRDEVQEVCGDLLAMPTEPDPEPRPVPEPALPPEAEADSAPPDLDVEFVVGDDVGAEVHEAVTDALAHAAAFLDRRTGYHTDGFTVYLFAEPEPLVSAYLQHHDMPDQERPRLLDRWRDGGAEASQGALWVLPTGRMAEQGSWTDWRADHVLYPITHEYVHIIQWSFAPNLQWSEDTPLPIGPYWLVEGVAEYFAALHTAERRGAAIDGWRRSWSTRAAATDAGLRDLESWAGMEAAGIAAGYALGTVAVDQLADLAGIDALLEYSEAVGRSGRWQDGFEATFGMTVDQFYDTFQDPRG